MACYQQGQIFVRFKLNDSFINMMNKFGISKSIMNFYNINCKISKQASQNDKSLLSPHFLKKNFKIIKEMSHEKASEFRQHFLSKYFYFKIT